MEQIEFGRLIGKICHYWERKIPKEEEALEWFEMVRWIPDGNGEDIFQRFTRMDNRPGNIPMRIQEVYKSFQGVHKRDTDFLISMVMRNADDYGLTHLDSFYDLRQVIRTRELNIGPAIRWLRSEGFAVDVERLKEPSQIDFGMLRDWLDNPGRLRVGREMGED